MQERFHAFKEIQELSESDREALFDILVKAQEGDSSALEAVCDLVYDEIPVPLEEFVCGRRYLGLRGNIDPEKINILEQFAKPETRKMYVAAGSGGGKSFMVSIAMAWQVYNLVCLKNPDLFYMLGPGAKIAIINLSVSKDQAKDVIFTQFLARVSTAPWFARRYKEWSMKAQFPKRIFAFSGGSGAIAYYGYDTIMGSLDEASWLVDRNDRSVAEELCEALLKSLNTRFPRAYKLWVISTLRSNDDYLSEQIERIKDTGKTILNTPSL